MRDVEPFHDFVWRVAPENADLIMRRVRQLEWGLGQIAAGGPWNGAALIARAALKPDTCGHTDDGTFNGQWCAYCNPGFGGDRGSSD